MKSIKFLVAAAFISATTIAPAMSATLKAEGGSAAGLSVGTTAVVKIRCGRS